MLSVFSSIFNPSRLCFFLCLILRLTSLGLEDGPEWKTSEVVDKRERKTDSFSDRTSWLTPTVKLSTAERSCVKMSWTSFKLYRMSKGLMLRIKTRLAFVASKSFLTKVCKKSFNSTGPWLASGAIDLTPLRSVNSAASVSRDKTYTRKLEFWIVFRMRDLSKRRQGDLWVSWMTRNLHLSVPEWILVKRLVLMVAIISTSGSRRPNFCKTKESTRTSSRAELSNHQRTF